MQITKLQYGLTVKDKHDNYKKAYLEADIHPSDNFFEVRNELMAEVQSIFSNVDTAKLDKKPENNARKAVKKAPVAKKEEAPVEEDKKEEVADEKVAEKPVSRREYKDKPKPILKKATRASTKKTTVYSRDVKAHKTHLKNLLNDKYPEWTTPGTALNDAAKSASTGLVGVELLDLSGIVLDSFIKALDKLMVGDDGL